MTLLGNLSVTTYRTRGERQLYFFPDALVILGESRDKVPTDIVAGVVGNFLGGGAVGGGAAGALAVLAPSNFRTAKVMRRIDELGPEVTVEQILALTDKARAISWQQIAKATVEKKGWLLDTPGMGFFLRRDVTLTLSQSQGEDLVFILYEHDANRAVEVQVFLDAVRAFKSRATPGEQPPLLRSVS